jgi:hypothetical protein
MGAQQQKQARQLIYYVVFLPVAVLALVDAGAICAQHGWHRSIDLAAFAFTAAICLGIALNILKIWAYVPTEGARVAITPDWKSWT